MSSSEVIRCPWCNTKNIIDVNDLDICGEVNGETDLEFTCKNCGNLVTATIEWAVSLETTDYYKTCKQCGGEIDEDAGCWKCGKCDECCTCLKEVGEVDDE